MSAKSKKPQRANLIPPSHVYPVDKRPLRALLRQRLTFVWQQTKLQSQQLAYNLPAGSSTNRDRWQEQLLKVEPDPIRQLTLQNNLAIKLARSVYYMLKNHTVFDPERLVGATN